MATIFVLFPSLLQFSPFEFSAHRLEKVSNSFRHLQSEDYYEMKLKNVNDTDTLIGAI